MEAAAIHEAFFGGQDVDVAEARGCSTAVGKLLVGSVKTVRTYIKKGFDFQDSILKVTSLLTCYDKNR